MPKIYETGTARQVHQNALLLAIENRRELIDAYAHIRHLSAEDRQVISDAKAEIRDYQRMLKTK